MECDGCGWREAWGEYGCKQRFGIGEFVYFFLSCLDTDTLSQGKVFSTVFSPDDPLTLAAAGSKAKVQVWDVASSQGARKAFGKKLAEAGRQLREKERASGGVIGVVSDDDESGDEGPED